MPKQINTYTFGSKLVSKFGLKGRYQPVLDEVIVPVTVVDSKLSTRIAIGGAISPASGAGNQGIVRLHNPVNSGVLITLKQWWAVSGAPTTDFLELSISTALTAAGFHAWRDGRINGEPFGVTSVGIGGAIVLGPPLYHLDSDDKTWDQEWVLEPGQRLDWRQNAQNNTLTVNMIWEEETIGGGIGA